MNLKEELIKLSKENNIDKIGFASFQNDEEYKKIEKDLTKKGFITSFHKEYNYDEYKEYKTAIVILISYYNELIENIDSLDENIVYFSSSSWGNDYHKVLNEKLTPLKELLDSKGYNSKICIDTNSLSERKLALDSGLGFIGLNTQLINEELGSYVFIGVLLTDAIIEPDKKTNKTCLKCKKCIEACPSKCINGYGSINGNKCLSYITQKKEITESEESLMNNCIYGCDICSRVCPHNKNLKTNSNFKLTGNEFININEYKHLSNKEFKEKYGNLSGSWRGKSIIERNISIYSKKLEKKKIK